MVATAVLLHGFTNTGASWGPVVAALGESYRAITPDIRGHGTAADAQPVSLDAVLTDVSETAPERFTLVGYSMGGRIALHLALQMPERVERLVLIGASPGLSSAQERGERRAADEALADELAGSSIETFAERWAQTPVLAGVAADVAARARADRLRNTPAGLARALRGLGTGALPPLWDRLGELRMPATLVVGERDTKFRAIATQMAAALPAATVVVIAGTGHAAHLEAPTEVAAVVAGGATMPSPQDRRPPDD